MELEDKVRRQVARFPGFNALSAYDWLGPGSTLELLRFEAGSEIELGTAMDFLLEGTVCLRWLLTDGREITFDYMRPGDVIGALGLADDAMPPFSVVAKTEVVLHRMPRAAFMDVAAKHPALMREARGVLERALTKVQRRLQQMVFLDLRGRVLSALGDLASEHGEMRGDDVRVSLSLTHQDIACLVGATREATSNTLTRLRGEGKLEFDGKCPVLRRYRLSMPSLN